jgi:hypothetical protein
MPENEDVPTEVATEPTFTSRFESQLPLHILRAAHAKGFARKVTIFTKNPAAGDYSVSVSRSLPSEYNAKRITINIDAEQTPTFLMLREPASCRWVAVPLDVVNSETLWLDVFDLLWKAVCVADTRDELEQALLLQHNFLSPEVTSSRLAHKLEAAVRKMPATIRELFLDPEDFHTTICEGCENCDPTTSFHRIDNSPRLEDL